VKSAAGYSGTPLAQKLGLKDGFKVLLIAPPKDYAELLGPAANSVSFVRKAGTSVDLVHLFVSARKELAVKLKSLRSSLRSEVPIWVSWPKKASKLPTNITEEVIREVALPMGFVDIKVCAVTEVFSGLKLVVRKELR
jgi:hypothetical protein